ncbi:MAG: type IV pilus assembly protein PilM [Phycisphaerae bacterium]
MAIPQSAWGIDMGRCAFKAIKLRQGADGAVEVVAHDFIEHAKILSQPDADRHALISEALEKFLSRNDISRDQVVVSVPGQHTLARFTKLPPVAQRKIPDIVRYEADQQIPFDMDEVIWDYQTFAREGLPDVEVAIFAMKRELIREHLLHFEQAAIEPVAVQAGPLALYSAAHYDGWLATDTTILLDIGAESTDLVIATPYNLWTRTIPIGGNKFTETLVKSFKLSFAKAENLKRAAATSKYARQIFQAMRPVFADLVQELQRSVGFYTSTHRDAEIEKVVALGNACKLPGLQKYLQQNLGLPVERPDGFKKAARPGGEEDRLGEHVLGFFGAYGLALQGLELAPIGTSLLPAEIAKQVVWRRKRPAFAAAAACLVLAGGTIWFRQSTDMSALAANSQGWNNIRVTIDEASDIIASPLPATLSPRARAKQALEAGKALRQALKTWNGKGERERAETEDLITLQRNKALIPRIVRVIHESVPPPPGRLADARTQADVLNAIEAFRGAGDPAAERSRRAQITIVSLDMSYEADVHLYDWESRVPVPDPINPVKEDLPGLVVRIRCRTPYAEGAKLVDEQFMSRLRSNGRVPGQGFYFDRVYLVDGQKVEIKTAAGTRGLSAGRARGRTQGGGFGLTPAGGAVAGALPPAALDPITNESIENDWEFDIWLDVILEDYEPPVDDGEDDAPDDDGA